MLSAPVVLAATPSGAPNASRGSTRGACSGITGWLVANPNYVWHMCNGKAWPIDNRNVTPVDVDGTMLDVEATFCYPSEMLCSDGVCERVIAARCCEDWGKFRKLLPVLPTRHISPNARFTPNRDQLSTDLWVEKFWISRTREQSLNFYH